EVAVALAEGIRRRVGSTLGVGITGIAGPGGGSEEKPVGTVHIALASTGETKTRALRFPGDRDMVRMQASQAALDLVRMHFLYNGSAKRSRVVQLFVALEIPDRILEMITLMMIEL